MAKRKPAFEIEEVLPNDNQLGQRSIMWKTFMDKYSKPNDQEENDIMLESVCEMLDYEPSDKSNASDVQTDPEAEDENFDRDILQDDVQSQLVEVVARRKNIWAKTGLMDMMKAVEYDQDMPSDLKVEKWLFTQHTGPFDMTRNRETVVTEKNAVGDSMRYYRKQEVTVSRDADDADSLSTVDEKNYILNVKDQNPTITSKIKVIQTFRIKTSGSSNALVKLPAISGFPILEEEPMASTSSWLHRRNKSDSAVETGEDQSQNRSREPPPRNPVPAPVLQSTRDNKRKKVFKKTVKKKSSRTSPSKKLDNGALQYESALQRCGTVKKIATGGGGSLEWQEMTYIAESSSDESDQVFAERTTRSKVATAKRELRSSSRSSRTPEKSPRKRTPRKKVNTPRKTVVRELVGTFSSICLSPKKKPMIALPPKQASLEQTTNLTALFNSANDKIANSTSVNHNTTAFSNRSMIPDTTRGIVVYKPKTIQSEAAADARIRITANDLDLDQVTKPRHLEGFRKFDHSIHPNSSVLFFPSDSEDDEPLATQTTTATTTTTTTDGDLSFDDDDPILTFKPRTGGRLNVMEYRCQ